MPLAKARMNNGRPWDSFVKTILAGPPVAKEKAVRAEQPIVVERLNDRHTRPSRRMAGSWGDPRKRVMQMHDIGLGAPDQSRQINVRMLVPECLPCKLQQSSSTFSWILTRRREHLMAPFSQDLRLGGEDTILTAGLAIVVMNQQHARGTALNHEKERLAVAG